ncbi:hypothetical protein [Paenibacillus endoradicis]|uniref:hypothetical protein n=1 Tax=Paenibacillus endoradicis TaxID=2972487 RepID=UPI002158A6A0|nr:hypothetical protein [Paenibacillus endoradicis]MCR8658520.1 hypothetical protein [Paenibacillus endoradicis]
MPTSYSLEHVQLAAQLADLKQEHYHTLLTLNALIAILTSKGLVNDAELQRTMNRIDRTLEQLIANLAHPKVSVDQQR